MKINVYTICKNEARLAPFYADYWKALSDDVHVYVYDGMSDDGTREILNQYPFVTIVDSPQNSKCDDAFFQNFKNNIWKGCDCDFVMVCDFDETIFSKDIEILRSELQYMKDNGYTILSPLSFDIVADDFPDYQTGKYLHELCRYGQNNATWYTKPILFNPKEITNVNYCMGAHFAQPIGNVKWYYSPQLFMIHGNYIGIEYQRDRIKTRELSEFNKNNNILARKEWLENNRLENEYELAKSKRFLWNDAMLKPEMFYHIIQDHRCFGIPMKKWSDCDFGNYKQL